MTRITTSEVCALGRFSRATLWRRVKAGTLPAPIDQSRQAIFERERVIAALGVPRPRWRVRPAGGAPTVPSEAMPSGGPVLRRWSAERWELA